MIVNNAPVNRPDPAARARQMVQNDEAVASQVQGDDVVVYRPGSSEAQSLNDQPTRQAFFQRVFLPSNMPGAVSADYVPSRKWEFAHQLANSVTDYMGTASALNAVGVGSGPLTVGMAWMLRDAIDGVGKVAGTALAKGADRDPRSYTLRGDYINTAGTVLETGLALVPGAFLAVAPAASAIKAFGSTVKGAAEKPIEVHQAIANNIGEVSSKNNAQSFVADAIGGVLGLGMEAGGKALIGPAAVPLVTVGAGALRLYTEHKYVQSLNMDQVTEKSLGRLLKGWVEDGHWDAPRGPRLLERTPRELRKINLGADLKPFMQNQERFAELRSLYSGRNYILDVHDDHVDVLLNPKSDKADQFTAMSQAVVTQMLRRGDAYQALKQKQGAEAADRWAVETSLRATPADASARLQELRQAGWESDQINFNQHPARADWHEAAPAQLAPLGRDELKSLLQKT